MIDSEIWGTERKVERGRERGRAREKEGERGEKVIRAMDDATLNTLNRIINRISGPVLYHVTNDPQQYGHRLLRVYSVPRDH